MQNPATVYRPAVISDHSAIVDFQIKMAFETEAGLKLDRATVELGVKKVLDDSRYGFYFVGERAGEVIASMLITFEWSDWRNGQVWWIQSVYVKPEHRAKKTFSGLYQYVRKIVEADENLRGLRLYVDKRNQIAQKVYVSLGMNGEHYHLYEWMKTF